MTNPAAGMRAFSVVNPHGKRLVLEAALAWGDHVLGTRHIEPGTVLTLGEDVSCTFFVPAERIGTVRLVIVTWELGEPVVNAPSGATVRAAGEVRPPGETPIRERQTVEVLLGDMVLSLRLVPREERIRPAIFDVVRSVGAGQLAASAFLHITLLASVATAAPALGSDDAFDVDRERLYVMRALLDTSGEREQERLRDHVRGGDAVSGTGQGVGGARASRDEGVMGSPVAIGQKRWAAKGTARPEDVNLLREKQLELAATSGMIDLIGTMALRAESSPAVSWGARLNGSDAETRLGGLWNTDIGDAFGVGLGLSGVGEGGGCVRRDCRGIGTSDVGGLGRHLGNSDLGGPCPVGHSCMGFGRSKLGGFHVARGPRLPVDAKVEVSGRIPADVIQRIVRQNFGRFRSCYDGGLRFNPSLAGRVATKFVIGRDGAVMSSLDGGSDLPDVAVTNCVVKTFYNLSFPLPEGGAVTVTYPITFSPGE